MYRRWNIRTHKDISFVQKFDWNLRDNSNNYIDFQQCMINKYKNRLINKQNFVPAQVEDDPSSYYPELQAQLPLIFKNLLVVD